MKKRAYAFCLSIGLMLTGCSGNNAADTEIMLPIYGADEIKYEIATAQYMDISDSTSIAAVIGYPYAVHVPYPADAQVIKCDLVTNREVAKGDILVELDSADLDYAINNQQTIVNNAYSAAMVGGKSAQLQYEIEKLTLDMLMEEKESYTIRAPFDGIITYAGRVTSGSTVKKGDVCFTISEVDRVGVYVEGGDSSKFRFGQKVQVKVDGILYDAVVVEAPDVAPSTASRANRAIFDLGEGTLAKIAEDNPMAITAGWATVYVTDERKNVLAVPDASVKNYGSDHYVTILDGEERYKLDVTIGKQLGGFTEILNGITAGDVVIAEGSGEFSSDEQEEHNDWDGERPKRKDE